MTFSLSGIAILTLACLGNAEWWIALVNRSHSLGYRHRQLLNIRRLHDAGVLLFPLAILWLAGTGEKGLLFGGSYSNLPLVTQTILGGSIAGMLPLLAGSIRWHLGKRPNQASLRRKQIFKPLSEVAADSKEHAEFIGQRSSILSALPFNEIFQLEVNHKRVVVSSRDGKSDTRMRNALRIAHFSDLHLLGTPGFGYHKFVAEQLCSLKPDLFAFTGDLLDDQTLVSWAETLFRDLAQVAPGYFVLGNHDWHLDHEAIRSALEQTGWTSVAERSVVVQHGGFRISVAGTEAPWIGANPSVNHADHCDLRLLLSHAPDQRDFAIQNGFDLMLSGHNHGGQVVLPLIGPVHSPSIFGVRYAAGLFSHGPLQIHVSRGVAGKDLLRWNCRPEITLLEIELPFASLDQDG